jgi:hypothetical protein
MPTGEDYRRLEADASTLSDFLVKRRKAFASLPDPSKANEDWLTIVDRAWIPYLLRLGPRPDQADLFAEHLQYATSVITEGGFVNPRR